MRYGYLTQAEVLGQVTSGSLEFSVLQYTGSVLILLSPLPVAMAMAGMKRSKKSFILVV